jgi:hypothetical protein
LSLLSDEGDGERVMLKRKAKLSRKPELIPAIGSTPGFDIA